MPTHPFTRHTAELAADAPRGRRVYRFLGSAVSTSLINIAIASLVGRLGLDAWLLSLFQS